MVILGIDPGTRFAGFGIMQKDKQKVFLLDYGCLVMSPTKSLPERVEIFHDFFSEKIQKYGVTDLALETPFLGKSAGNFLKLGYMRGILYLLASKNKLVLHEFAPREIKLTVTGFGGASKEQVASVVLRMLPGILGTQKDDVTDALAISLCGLWQSKFSKLTLNSK